jgi:hypothetical protein
MEAPRNLRHKPVWVVDFYNKKDAYNAPDSDAKALSLGIAQWNENDNTEPSLKVWRYAKEGGKWSRQSEELPLHRVLDLAILLCSTMIESHKDCLDKNDYTLDVRLINEEYGKVINDFIKKHEEKELKPRLKTLKKILDEIIK